MALLKLRLYAQNSNRAIVVCGQCYHVATCTHCYPVVWSLLLLHLLHSHYCCRSMSYRPSMWCVVRVHLSFDCHCLFCSLFEYVTGKKSKTAAGSRY